jgi:hypothetical protein
MIGYLIYAPSGRRVAAHSDGSMTIVDVDGATVQLSPDDVETVREVLRLAAGLHGRARRKACAAAHAAIYEEMTP